ncbi:MAG: hypothetical protein AAFU61_13530 [Pseudomonadota bacterium]
MSDGDGLRISRDGAVVRLTLDRPAARNALSRRLKAALEAALARIAKGFRLVTIASDARLMAAGAKQVTETMRAGLDRRA